MGKVEIGIYFFDFDKMFTEMFLEYSSSNHMNFIKITDFDWLPCQPKG